MSYNTVKATYDVGDNQGDFAYMCRESGFPQVVEVFLQNPVIVNMSIKAYGTPKVYAFDLFFDPPNMHSEAVPLLCDSGLVSRVDPPSMNSGKVRCLRVLYKDATSVARYTGNLATPVYSIDSGWGSTLKTDTSGSNVLWNKFSGDYSLATMQNSWNPLADSNPRTSPLPRFPFTYFRFNVYPIQFATDNVWMTTGKNSCGELLVMGANYPNNNLPSTDKYDRYFNKKSEWIA